jgi:Fe-S-cluster containining protein
VAYTDTRATAEGAATPVAPDVKSPPFAALVDRALAWLRPVPVVSPEQYRAITCNRCGVCCEDIMCRDSPEQVAARLADPATDPDRRKFLSGLEFVGRVGAGWRFRCRHFSRDAEGLGVCGIHETRPNVCRDFPYGLMVRSWTQCAWYVEVRDADGNVVEHVQSCV